MRIHLILLNCTHEIVKIVNSVSCIFYHNKENRGKKIVLNITTSSQYYFQILVNKIRKESTNGIKIRNEQIKSIHS